MLEIGKTIICMDLEYTLGKMVENMRGNISLIRNMEMECIYGQMEEVLINHIIYSL